MKKLIRVLVVFCIASGALQFLASPVEATAEVLIEQEVGTSESVFTSGVVGQSFTPTSNILMTKATFRLSKVGTPNPTITFHLSPTQAGVPNGTDLGNCTVATSTLSNYPTFSNISFTLPSTVVLENGTMYAIWIENEYIDGSNKVEYLLDQSDGSAYTGGTHLGYVATWSIQNTDDMDFQIYGYEEPVVETDAATSITTTTAQLNGNLTFMGVETEVTTYFLWGVYGENQTYQTIPTGMNATGTFNTTITDLVPNQHYSFQAAVHWTEGGVNYYYQALGEDFYTTGSDPTIPLVVTNDASSITNTTATLNGELIQIGAYSPVSVWFQIRQAGETTWHTVTNGTITEMNATGPFLAVANSTTVGFGITPNTWYEFQAVASDGGYTQGDYGEIRTFLTNDQLTPPSFTFALNDAGSITKNTAVLSGQLSNVAQTANATVYFDYGIGTYTVFSGIVKRTGPGDVVYTASSLQPGITYWFRARIYVGDSYMVTPQKTFTTLTESGSTPGVTPTPSVGPTPSSTPVGPVTLPPSWNTTLGHWLLIAIALFLCPVCIMFVFSATAMQKALGAVISTVVDGCIFGLAWSAQWIDIWAVGLIAALVAAIFAGRIVKMIQGQDG